MYQYFMIKIQKNNNFAIFEKKKSDISFQIAFIHQSYVVHGFIVPENIGNYSKKNVCGYREKSRWVVKNNRLRRPSCFLGMTCGC